MQWLNSLSFLTASNALVSWVNNENWKCIFVLLGQDLLQKSNATDASGNAILSDFGVHMQQKVSLANPLVK